MNEFEIEQLTRPMKDALLDVILNWGRMEVSLKGLLAEVRGETVHETFKNTGYLSLQTTLHEFEKALEGSTNQPLSDFFENWRSSEKLFSDWRHDIAHGYTVGVRKDDPNTVVILRAKVHEDGGLEHSQIHVEDLKCAAGIAKTISDTCTDWLSKIEGRA